MNTTAEIYDLMETTGKSAPDITQALKNIGGDMQTGIKRIGEYFHDEGMLEGFQTGKHIGEKDGFIKGSAITIAVMIFVRTGFYLYDKYKEKVALEEHEAEGEEILEGLKAAIATEEEVVQETAYDNCVGEIADGAKSEGEL